MEWVRLAMDHSNHSINSTIYIYILKIKQNNNEQIGFVHYGWT